MQGARRRTRSIAGVVIAGAAHRQRHDEHAILVVAEVERTEALNRAQEESAADEEQRRQHDLGDEQTLAQRWRG